MSIKFRRGRIGGVVMILTALAALCAFAAFGIRSLATSSAAHAGSKVDGGICVPILMYHEVKYTGSGKDAITPYEFESDLSYLSENGYTSVTMRDLIAYVSAGVPLPPKPVVLTFDDGYLNNYVYAYPLLKKYRMKIVLSIIGKDTDNFTYVHSDNIDYSHVTWNQINEMLSSGLVEIQNHTYNLHSITQSRYGCGKQYGETQEHYEEVLTDDLLKLQTELKIYTGADANTFTYPYGKVSGDSVSIIKALGFRASLSCSYGVNILTRNPDDLFGLRRICRAHGTSAQKSIDTAMETLKYRKSARSSDPGSSGVGSANSDGPARSAS